MNQILILYPLFALAALTFFVLFRMGYKRNKAVKDKHVPIKFYRTYDVGEEPEHLRVYTRHFINLFEAPVLFYVGVILCFVTQSTTLFLLISAWLYVGLRYWHSYIHLTYNNIQHRFLVYGISWLVLLALWIGVFIQTIAK